MDYYVYKKYKDIDPLDLNGILSTIYTPIVPSMKKMDIFSYKKNKDNFEVRPFGKGSLISGIISKDLTLKLKDFDIILNEVE